MKITYYGTAAGEGWPGVFCQCPLCRQARALGGKNIRTRSQALINSDLLLDLPPDNQLHSLYYGLDLGRVQALLFTHSHSDHCYAEDLEFLREPFSHTRRGRLLVGGNEAVAEKVRRACGCLEGDRERLTYRLLRENVPTEFAGYTVLPLRATHSPGERCLFYRISQGGKSVLYAHDTGRLTAENLAALAEQPEKLSLVSLDCTTQKRPDGNYHMGLPDDIAQKEQLLSSGLADENTIWVVNHFSHNGGYLHEEMSREAEKYGFLASYDGMTIEF
ncbi:MAG: MBL fold metallo-hydrolase [Firmicutes bacterium]|nr:MBL fold metallo-hydrolase [Bacillota bacterium]